MAIVNFRIKKIAGERKKDKLEKVSANANSTIVSMKKQKDATVGEYLLVNFKYEVDYEPDVGKIMLEGIMWYLHPELNKMIIEGDDSMEVKKEALIEITGTALRDSLLESLDIARKLHLPPPLQMPRVEVKKDQLKFKKAS